MKVIVEMLTAFAMLGKARYAWMAFAIMANASEVAASRISEEYVGAAVDGLSSSFEASASTSEFDQIHLMINRYEDIGVFWNCLACR